MTINGKDITVKALIEGNKIRWNANCNQGLVTNDLIDIQSYAGYCIRDFGYGEMKFLNDAKECFWSCFATKEDYNSTSPF